MTEPTDATMQQRCAEVVEWQRTGELRSAGALRAYAAKHWHGHHDSLQMAERATETQAMEAVARWGTHSQAGAITPPPIECDTEELKRAYAFGWWSALEKQRETAQAGAVGKAVHQFRKKHCADWYDGFADHSDGGGPYEERTLYTAGAVPLTPEQIKAMDRRHPAEDLCGWSYRMGVADAEAHHGIKGGQHGTE